MKHITKIRHIYDKSLNVIEKNACEIFNEWQNSHPEIVVESIQEADYGLFIVYRKEVETRENAYTKLKSRK